MKRPATSVSTQQHLTLMVCVCLVTALGLWLHHRRNVQRPMETLAKAAKEEQGRLDFLKRGLNAFKQPDIAAARQALLDAESRLRGLKIEGDTAEGTYISNSPPSEVNAFLSRLSILTGRCGLTLLSHRSLKSGNTKLKELIIREMKLQGSFPALATFIQKLGSQPYRILILQTQLKQPADGPLESTVVFSL